MKVNLSISFYLKTVVQSEINNEKIEKHLCMFVNYEPDD